MENRSCPICLNDNIKEFIVKLKCLHCFCLFCIMNWMLRSKNCPVCRHLINNSEIVTIFKINEWKILCNTDDKIDTIEKSNAIYSIGYCFFKGIILEKNLEKSIKWFKKGIIYKNVQCLSNLAEIYEIFNDCDRSFMYYEKAIQILENNDHTTTYQIKEKEMEALMFDNDGSIVTPKAKIFYNFANFLYAGRGCKKNDKKAFKYYLKAADYNLLRSQYNVAMCLWNGIGTNKNIKEALKWYNKSAKSGCKKSTDFLKNLTFTIQDQTPPLLN